jgi:hypothetical protein
MCFLGILKYIADMVQVHPAYHVKLRFVFYLVPLRRSVLVEREDVSPLEPQ